MLKILAVFAMFLAVTCAFVPVMGQTANSTASDSQKQNNGGNDGKRPAKCAALFVVQDNGGPVPEAESKESTSDNQRPTINVTNPAPMPESWSWHDKVAWGAGLLLLVVAGITLRWFIIQTTATKKAAEAALLNAQAIINAERAWIAVTIVEEFSTPDREESIEEHNRRVRRFAVAQAGKESPTFHISCINKGRTPAKVIGGDFSHCFIDLPDNLPVPVEYSSPIFMPDPTFVVNGESFRLHPGFKPDFTWKRGKTPEEVGYFTDFLMFYGRIAYEDIFTLPDGSRAVHETRWCFAYRPGDERPFVACGPSEYNGHT